MRTRSSFWSGGFWLSAALVGCAGPDAPEPSRSGAPTELFVRASFDASADREPVGWIYAFEDARGRKDRCVYIWSDATWTLAEETTPGFYGDEIAFNCVGAAPEGSMLPVLDFPAGALDGWQRVHVAGHLEASYKGEPIPRDS